MMNHNAKYIWNEPTGKGRNIFRRFLLEFELSTVPEKATINLFADSRYRLFVNEHFISAGPARFVPSHPEYDTHNIASSLQTGSNSIVVEVTSFGATSFQTTRDSAGGFIAWGEIHNKKTVDLSTPGAWQVQTMDAWDSNSPPFSFAQGPTEIVDLRRLSCDSSCQPVLLENQERWGPLTPRSAPYPTLEVICPDKLLSVRNIKQHEQIIGFGQNDPEFEPGLRIKRNTVAYAAWIHSPDNQNADFGIFWGDHYLNGTALECQNDELRGNRQNTTLSLNKGWNLLYGQFEHLQEIWGLLLGIPADTGLTVRAQPDADCGNGILYTKPFRSEKHVAEHGSVPSDLEGLQALPFEWKTVPANAAPSLPARLRAWDVPDETAAGDSPLQSGTRTWVYEYEREFDGFISIEVEAPEGTVLDIGVDDWLRPDGLIHLYSSNPLVNSVDRYILAEGKQSVQSFHVRGGHYLQITITLPNGSTGPARLNDVKILSANCDFPIIGNFECSDAVLNWTCRTAIRTLQVSTEDSYADCPWRERGTYLGDGYINIHMHEMLNTDLRIPKRFLRLFAHSQFENGQMPSAAPSWMTYSLEDYTLIWIICLHDYWTLTQDTALVEELWPVLEKIWSSPAWIACETGLWNSDELTLFIDWGIRQSERRGKANGCLNAFRIRALECSAALADALSRTEQADAFRSEAETVRDAYSDQLWIKDQKRFAASLNADRSPADTPALHANVLAILYEAGTPEQLTHACEYVIHWLQKNTHRALKHGQFSGHAEYYFLFFVLEMLYRRGQPAVAEQIIRDNYRPMMDAGAGTLWECLCRGIIQQGSACHSWGGGPLVTALRYTLGVQLPDPKNPNKIRIAPQAETIDWAKGTYPHPKGIIKVEWKRVNGKIQINSSIPEGVELVDN